MKTLAVFTILCIGLVYGCSKVYEEITKCRSESVAVSIVCPAKHIIRVKDAKYMRSSTSSCTQSDLLSNTCVVSDGILDGVRTACERKLSCTYNMPTPAPAAPASCNGFSGQDYVWAMYTCEPEFNKDGNARAVSLCAKETWDISYAYIDNEPLAVLLNTFTKQTDCMCALTIPPNHEIAFQAVQYRKESTPRFKCDQRVVVWDDLGNSHTFCEKAPTPTLFGCNDKERRLMMRYETDDATIGSIFIVGIKVNHGTKFTMQCGLKYPDDVTVAPTTTTPKPTTTTTPKPTTTTPPKSTTTTPPPASTARDKTTAAQVPETTAAPGGGETTAAAVGPVIGQTTERPTDTSNSGPALESNNSSLIVGLIVGAVVLACLIMFIIILVMYCSHRRSDDINEHKRFHDSSSQLSNDSGPFNYTDYNRQIHYTKDPSDPAPYAYVTEVYVDGDTPSNLVLNKDKPFYVHT